MKIATINKLKQKLRDAINKDNSVAPCMLELAINDALGYNAETTVCNMHLPYVVYCYSFVSLSLLILSV